MRIISEYDEDYSYDVTPRRVITLGICNLITSNSFIRSLRIPGEEQRLNNVRVTMRETGLTITDPEAEICDFSSNGPTVNEYHLLLRTGKSLFCFCMLWFLQALFYFVNLGSS